MYPRRSSKSQLQKGVGLNNKTLVAEKDGAYSKRIEIEYSPDPSSKILGKTFPCTLKIESWISGVFNFNTS